MIENNTLTLDQVTAIIDGKRILGNPNEIIRDTLKNTDQVSDQVTDQVDDSVQRLLAVLGNKTLPAVEIMKRLEPSHRPTLRKNYLDSALKAHLIERRSPISLTAASSDIENPYTAIHRRLMQISIHKENMKNQKTSSIDEVQWS